MGAWSGVALKTNNVGRGRRIDRPTAPISHSIHPSQSHHKCAHTQNYPRGQRELLGPLTSAFGPKEAYE